MGNVGGGGVGWGNVECWINLEPAYAQLNCLFCCFSYFSAFCFLLLWHFKVVICIHETSCARIIMLVEWVIAEQGTYNNNSVLVPLYETLGPDACTFIINQSEMSMVICDTEVKAAGGFSWNILNLKPLVWWNRVVKLDTRGYPLWTFDHIK